MPLLVMFLLSFVALDGSGLQAEMCQSPAGNVQSAWKGTWSATSGTGLTLKGTWTAATDSKTGSVTGTWTLNDAKGRTLRRGGWSAAKSAKGWNGAWRAAVSGTKGEYSGTWSADVDLEPKTGFADLFELAVKTVASGNWRGGRRSGAWSIRAFD